MYIKKIILNNFRIYYDTSVIEFQTDSKKNIHIISGYNGYGKTSFLTSLVWCMYGKLMQEVENVFKKEIDEMGGYGKYVQSCINHTAKEKGLKEFSVEIHLGNVNIPSVICDEVVLKRTGYSKSGLDDLEILIDGQENELTKEVGNEIFIQDFILPKEIAKFFFFDAEKIVQLAENKSIADKRKLSKAYSEVIGIKKYEDLKNNLSDLRLRFRQNSAKKEDRSKFKKLSDKLSKLNTRHRDLEIEIEKKENQKLEWKLESDQLQENLIRKGSSLSVDEINNLRIDQFEIKKEIEELKNNFKELLEFAPFAIAGNLMDQIADQVQFENPNSNDQLDQKVIKTKSSKILKEFKKYQTTVLKKDKALGNQISTKLDEILQKHLLNHKDKNKRTNQKIILDWSSETQKQFEILQNQLKSSYALRVQNISKDLRDKRIQYGRITKTLNNAESKESDGVIKKYRIEKTAIDEKIHSLENNLISLHQEIGSLQHEKNSVEKIVSELSKKIAIRKQYIEKDKVAERLIDKLSTFLQQIKEQKKSSLESKILSSLQTLMHKKGMIHEVAVDVYDDLIDITLLDKKGIEIQKQSLSKGEQQLYATSILKALVEESNIDFPVFVDSPLQKFDPAHSQNVIKEFYPSISKQVILFPLLEKEINEKEFELIKKHLISCHLIKNKFGTQSTFEEVSATTLFKQSKLKNHVL
jgi:DNA sulfur modification protein DndD